MRTPMPSPAPSSAARRRDQPRVSVGHPGRAVALAVLITARPSMWRASTRSWRAGLAGLVLAGLVAGCGGGGGVRVRLPSSAPLSAPPGSSPAPSRSSGAAVAAAYAALFPAADRALLAPPEQIRAILAPYATDAYLDLTVRGVVDAQARHLEPWGHVVVHITKIDIGRGTATVHDCQDASNAGLADARTHRLDPKTRGSVHRNLIANMTLGGDGTWRVSKLRQFRAGCHP